MKKYDSVADIFEALGGTSAVARDLEVGTSTASEMKRRGRIPAEYWLDLITSARRNRIPDLDADVLVRVHARARIESAQAVSRSTESEQATGQFTRFKHLRKNRFQNLEEINDHISALREEWDRR